MSESEKTILVEVAYALPHKQRCLTFKVVDGCTAHEAVEQSGIMKEFPEIDLAKNKLGIFGKVLSGKEGPKVYQVKQGDRVEIYRPLLADPKESRRKRADKVKARKADEASE